MNSEFAANPYSIMVLRNPQAALDFSAGDFTKSYVLTFDIAEFYTKKVVKSWFQGFAIIELAIPAD